MKQQRAVIDENGSVKIRSPTCERKNTCREEAMLVLVFYDCLISFPTMASAGLCRALAYPGRMISLEPEVKGGVVNAEPRRP